ncbi:hypothetical protein [Mucilaginibacter sp. BT774]|uniref:hypothetical protein n=1 Tax=Mucilaginibacter sp. BT774 TaxID=3062276 RepID=UPI0026745588|nr:hypothetical protein [Mucilaginibacter sp. BT774]MDO3626189.1 hypothetical protein [Mucilaginibacter sp. BT774]
MNHLLFFSITLLFSFNIYAQTESEIFKKKTLSNQYLLKKGLKSDLIKYDFSKLLLHTDNSMVYGFIGDNYQRMRVKIIRVKKDSLLPDTYHVYGESMVKNNIDEFNGTLKISNIRQLKSMSFGVDDEYKNKGIKGEYVIIADYNFFENKDQSHSGAFNGVLESDFYLDKNHKVHYDDIEMNSDGYTNNQFVGQWIDYKSNLAKRCNWGDFRVPNSGDLDIGAGEFSPNDKYLKFGWQSVRDKNDKIEEAKWWE